MAKILRLQLDEKLLEKFRKASIEKFGYTKDALSKGAAEAFRVWLKAQEKKADVMKVIREVAGIWRGKESGRVYV
jgi:ribosomal protein L7/L12